MPTIVNFEDIYQLFKSISQACTPPSYNGIRIPQLELFKTHNLVTLFDKILKETPFEYDKNISFAQNMCNRLNNSVGTLQKRIEEVGIACTPYNFFGEDSIGKTIEVTALPLYTGIMGLFPKYANLILGDVDYGDMLFDVSENDGANIRRYSLLLSSLALRTYFSDDAINKDSFDNDKWFYDSRTTMGHFCNVNYVDWQTDYLETKGYDREETKVKAKKLTNTSDHLQLIHAFGNGRFE